jgi:hypothetical protein
MRRVLAEGSLATAALAVALLGARAPAWAGFKPPSEEDLAGWPVAVKGHVPVKPGEHPRLLFRKTDLAGLKARANTPEGKALIARLRLQLDGAHGETMTDKFGVKGPVSRDGAGEFDKAPLGYFTFSHAAGYGFLYLLTGNQKYADLGREAMEKAFEGYRDRDQRYSFRAPYGALRAGPSLGWTVLGYDLCYDGWDPAYRQQVARAIQEYNEGANMALEDLTRGKRQHPGSNHWGMQVGGAALALLAIMNDPGVDMGKIGPLLKDSQISMIVNLTQGFGDGGFFAEGDGTGSMSSHIVFLPALQAWKVAAGKDFYNPRPNAQWAALKWIFLTVPTGSKSDLRLDFPERGAYAHNIWGRGDLSGAGYFSMAFGLAPDDQKAALLWFYDRHLRAVDEKAKTPLDATTPYPHHTILAFVNWPLGLKPVDPDEAIPHAYRDTKWKFYAWRNRWQDENDVVISILTETSRGNYSAKGENALTVCGMGKKMKWGTISGGFTGDYRPAADGSTVLATGDGSCLAIDFSGACGADAMLVMTGPGAPADHAVEAGGTRFSFLFLAKGAPPAPKAQGPKVVVGGQTVSFDGRRIVLGK